MSRTDQRTRSQKIAAYLAIHSPYRPTFMCPMACGIPVKVSGNGRPLFEHFARCPGPRRRK